MLKLYLWIRNLLEGEEGQDLVEYALIIALVSIALVLSLGAVAGGIDTIFDDIVTKLGPGEPL